MRAAQPRTTLAALLRRGQLRVAVATMLLFGLSLMLIGNIVLGAAQRRHLELVARTVGYSVEAAVTFRDVETAREILVDLAARERLGEIDLRLPDGQLFASYRAEPAGRFDQLLSDLGRRLMSDEATAPVIPAGGRRIAEVRLRGEGLGLLRLLFYGVLAGLVCVGLALGVAALLTRRLERRVIEPINRLAALTRSIRSERAFGWRAPMVPIVELQALSDDFNAMLDEVEAREAELVTHQRLLQQDNDRLAYSVGHDPLTGLANRLQFERRLQEALSVLELHGGRLGVLYLDADGFKAVNDSAGLAAGDLLLTQIANRLRLAVRETDVVARLGGDEFAVLLYPLRNHEEAERITFKIRRQMDGSFDLGPYGRLRCSLSFGLAIYPDDGETVPTLLDTADRAMYRAKQLSRRSRQI